VAGDPPLPPDGEDDPAPIDLGAVRAALAGGETIQAAGGGSGGAGGDVIPITAGRRRRKASADGDDGKAPGPKEILLELALSAGLWHWDGEAFATFAANGHRENARVRTRQFSGWLRSELFARTGMAAGGQSMQDVIELAEARALAGPERKPFTRIAHDIQANRVYVDLGTPDWRAVEISATGWRVVGEPPVFFLRSKGMRPLPVPQPGGSLERLQQFVNVQRPEGFILSVAWVLGCFHPTGPYPAAVMCGGQGSAKSTTGKVLRSLVDPHVVPLRSPPREDRDLSIAALNTYVVGLDNLSSLPEWLSDGLCRIATGSGYGARKLHTGTEEDIFCVCRPIVVNGISEVAGRPDLADRALAIVCPQIEASQRIGETQFWGRFEEEWPFLLGALFDAVAASLKGWRDFVLSPAPRMADFAAWVAAAEAEMALPWSPGEFLAAYSGVRLETARATVDDDPFAAALYAFAKTRAVVGESAPHVVWEGSATELLTALRVAVPEAVAASKLFPQSPRGLSERVRRLAPALRDLGVSIVLCRVGHERQRIIQLVTKHTEQAHDR
jgi:hypothetical protein